LLENFSGRTVEVLMFANACNIPLFERISRDLNITINKMIQKTYNDLFYTDENGYDVHTITMSGNDVWNMKQIYKIKNINVSYNIFFDCLIVHGDCYKKTNKPVLMIAQDVFQSGIVDLCSVSTDLSMDGETELTNLDFNDIQQFLPVLFIVAHKFLDEDDINQETSE
jgi:hypothetical protein